MEKDTARIVVAAAITVGVTWWMLTKRGAEHIDGKVISTFQWSAIKRNQAALRKRINKLRRSARIPW